MKHLLIISALLLTGCNTMPTAPSAPLTAEEYQRRVLLLQQLRLNRPAPIQPYYMPPPPKTTRCVSRVIGTHVVTECN